MLLLVRDKAYNLNPVLSVYDKNRSKTFQEPVRTDFYHNLSILELVLASQRHAGRDVVNKFFL